MICSMGHMMYSCLIAYGIVLAKYRKKGTTAMNIVLFFLLACVWHGVYDFFLISDSVPKEFRIFSLLMVFVEIIVFSGMIRNTLNKSEFFDVKRQDRLLDLRGNLALWLICIVLFEYVCLAAKYGPEMTYDKFTKIVGLTWVLVLFFSIGLGRYELVKDKWTWIFKVQKAKVKKDMEGCRKVT